MSVKNCTYFFFSIFPPLDDAFVLIINGHNWISSFFLPSLFSYKIVFYRKHFKHFPVRVASGLILLVSDWAVALFFTFGLFNKTPMSMHLTSAATFCGWHSRMFTSKGHGICTLAKVTAKIAVTFVESYKCRYPKEALEHHKKKIKYTIKKKVQN